MSKRMIARLRAKQTTIWMVLFSIFCILMADKVSPTTTEVQYISFVPPANTEPIIETPKISVSSNKRVFDSEYPNADSQPLPVRPVVAAKAAADGDFIYSQEIPLSYELQRFTYDTCVKRGLEYEFVLALMWRESRFQVDAVNINTNGTQDSGLMQINDVNREWLSEEHGIQNLMDPMQNIEAGTIMLSTFVQKYGEHDALMAYQYGEAGMRQKIQEGIITNEQIEQLVEQRNIYRELLETT